METPFTTGPKAISIMAGEIAKRSRELEIARTQIQYVVDSNVKVTVQRALSTVEIADQDDSNCDVFLQGYQADDFIRLADETYERLGEISLDEAYQVIAYPYLDLMV